MEDSIKRAMLAFEREEKKTRMKYQNKTFSVAGGFCSRDCKHQGNKEVCDKCYRIQGKDTNYEPTEESK